MADAAPPKPPVRLRAFAATDTGLHREHNEDQFLVGDLSSGGRGVFGELELGPRGAVFAVCDGMGGAAAGEVASQLAVDEIFDRLAEKTDSPFQSHEELGQQIAHALESANKKVFLESHRDRSRRGMGSTATVAALFDGMMLIGQIGDSRAYVLRDGKITQVTRDQSIVAQLVEAGEITEEEAEYHELSNVVLQALGTTKAIHVELSRVDLYERDRVLVCSDGLSGMVPKADLETILDRAPTPEEACRNLIAKANYNGGDDNITAIVFFVEGPLERPEPHGPPIKYTRFVLPEARDISFDIGPEEDPNPFRSLSPLPLMLGASELGESAPDEGETKSASIEPKTPRIALGFVLFSLVVLLLAIVSVALPK